MGIQDFVGKEIENIAQCKNRQILSAEKFENFLLV